MSDDRLLERFIFRFYGYGNYDAKYWFVGMEEGIRKSKDSDKLENAILALFQLSQKEYQ
jgi:hypothetical protein